MAKNKNGKTVGPTAPKAKADTEIADDKTLEVASREPYGEMIETAEDEDETPAAPVKPKGPKTASKIVMNGSIQLFSHLYRLLNAKMRKNVSWSDIPDFVAYDHNHHFRTMDSNGKKLMTAMPIGGHFHDIELIEQGEGMAPLLTISPARKMVYSKKRKRYESVPVDGDEHTHDYEYIRTDPITLRSVNAEYVKAEAMARAVQTQKVEGVKG